MKKIKSIISLMAMFAMVVMLMPVKTFAAANPEYSDEFKKYLTDDGKLIVHSVPFSEIEGMEPWLASETIFMESKSMENQIFIKNIEEF